MKRNSTENESYVIPTTTFMPYFTIVENIKSGDEKDFVYNSDNWEYVFWQLDGSEDPSTGQFIEVAYCYDLI